MKIGILIKSTALMRTEPIKESEAVENNLLLRK